MSEGQRGTAPVNFHFIEENRNSALIMSFSHLETPFLFTATGAYLVAMLLLWTQLFLLPRSDKSTPGEWGRALLGVGAVFHLLALAGQGPSLFTLRAGTVGLFGWLLVVTYLVFGRRLGTGTGSVVAPVALCAALGSFAAPALHTWAPSGRLDSFWLATHVFLIVAGYVALAWAFVASLLYLAQEGLLKRRKLSGLWQKLPSLGLADEWIGRGAAFGLALLSLGILTGVAYSAVNEAFYEPWRDPKVLISGAMWSVWAFYLAARWRLGWHGRRSSLFVVGGFVLVAISFFRVPHLVPASPAQDIAERPKARFQPARN